MNGNDVDRLTELNQRFVNAFRIGSWALLRPLLAPDFAYLDGATGDVWPIERYIADIEGNPLTTIDIDQIRVHVAGDVALVSARSAPAPGRFNRYVDTYQRRDGDWLCVHACVWPVQSR